MYLKSLEMIGFKSFAEKTKLDFEPGMTCIVGPNGCGKSNIADAIRWVLGEQSAKALRGGKMQDVIFNGTETAKPMGMCEVSLMLTDCESTLGTDYNEVTVARRVLRSGEGQYFINRAPCRLKDIQRLFMDTGIGTDSYSIMEQGKIDRVLSSRPDERRAVFEEASGITKYKADKKEALRKLDHTEANLLRLDDIIREVRRQIISLQRQAGKARRYQSLQATLRDHDLYFTRERLNEIDADIERIDGRLASLRDQVEAARADLAQLEEQVAVSRSEMAEREQRIGELMEAASEARGRLDRCRESMRVNQDRIQELNVLAERDRRDAEEAAERLALMREEIAGVEGRLEEARGARDHVNEELVRQAAALAEIERQTDAAERSLHAGRTELIELESRAAALQNELADLEAQERTHLVRRERLSAERAEMERSVAVFAERVAEMEHRLGELRAAVDGQAGTGRDLKERRKEMEGRIHAARKAASDLQSRCAAKRAEVDLMARSATEGEGFPGGARFLLDPRPSHPIDRSMILGPLADHLRTDGRYQAALEAVLRCWHDAVVVREETAAVGLARMLRDHNAGSARLLPVALSSPPPGSGPDAPGPRLVDVVTASDEARPLVERLLAGVVVVERMDDLPETAPPGLVHVSLDGAVRRGGGILEWWAPDDQPHNPLARAQQLSQWRDELADVERQAEEREREREGLQRQAEELAQRSEAAAAALEGARRELNLAEGEHKVLVREAKQAADRLDTVSYEVQASSEQGGERQARREAIVRTVGQVRERQEQVRAAIASQTQSLREREQARSGLREVVTEQRVRFAERRHQVEHLESQHRSLAGQAAELDGRITERRSRCDQHASRVETLKQAIDDAARNEEPLAEACRELQEQLHEQREAKQESAARVESLESDLRDRRAYVEEITAQRSALDVTLAEQRLRRQTQLDRVAGDYGVRYEDVVKHPEPEWEGGERPDRDTLDTLIGELRAKLDSLGPVNLVAIEEHRELEERYAFLTQQQDDLVNAKQQLMEMIREINKKTTEMFSATFDAVNENFQEMFKKLFGGGGAKLVLVDEESVLESGIEIIARPPGKKLQTVSLLSGGERTMTAVALLFALYLVKPSPFCVLDELDAALDEANIGRFVDTVTEFLRKSQFIVITHNRRTIGACDVLYGVTMPDRGMSRVVSLKMSDYSRGGVPATAAS